MALKLLLMHLETISPRKAIDNAFLQESINKTDFETFRQSLLKLLNQADNAVEEGESEEHLKNLITPFLKGTNFGDDHYINTKERQDLAIHNGKTGSSNVGVIIEAKRPSNNEMITEADLNRKAFHEAILYYLRERIDNGNEDIKHIIITDVYQWFVFDAQDFERHFYESEKLRGWYQEWKQGQKVNSSTQFVYDHLLEFVGELDANIRAAHLSLSSYRSLLEKEELSRDEQKKLVPVYKLFTPVHLLKQPFASDSNELNKAFYRELLYIMGLKEYKKKGTHYITRLDEENRQYASLIENIITQLKSVNVLSRLSNRSDFGDDESEQLLNVAIQLLITWINRILFLKLLEAQLFKYHREDERFQFLNHQEIAEYDGLNKLFFQVLAEPIDNRSERINNQFGHIPYLNSSLFDVADIEDDAIFISALEDGLQMPVDSRSKLRNREGDRLKDEKLSTLEYLLRFLDAYNFNTEGTAEVQEETKTLINASVLGRIFEKINGYKDGSFFTPGYITEYMSRETIRRSVVQKFNEAHDSWECEGIEEVAGKISRHELPYDEANEIVNSITICDPAVGSGHFLVSALDELIAIKSDLRIFVDEKGQRIRDVDISVDNDELSIAVGQDPFFEYRVHHSWKDDNSIERTVGADTQRLQKALFREKNILIENCLFGVDINPNSVNICRLRLWIELLKHAYYKESTDFQQLEVLPNIDINIKQGNSLVSRFDLDADLSEVFSDSDHSVDDYKQAVEDYKKTNEQAEKRRLETYIGDVKDDFSSTLLNNRPINKKLSKARGTLEMMQNSDLFGDKKFTKKEIKEQKTEVQDLEKTKAEEEDASFYDQAFEWRFEFPEVLDEDGNFTGFDAVIGNPPYVRIQTLKANDKLLADHYKEEFQAGSRGNFDIYALFVERGLSLIEEGSVLNFILPHKFFSTKYGQPLRKLISENQYLDKIVHFQDIQIFDEASTYVCLLTLSKKNNQKTYVNYVQKLENWIAGSTKGGGWIKDKYVDSDNWNFVVGKESDLFYELDKYKKLGEAVDIFVGLQTSADTVFLFKESELSEGHNTEVKSKELNKEFSIENELLKEVVRSGEIGRYWANPNALVLFPYKTDGNTLRLISQGEMKEDYPGAWSYLKENKSKLENRENGKFKGESWYQLYPKNLDEWTDNKILVPYMVQHLSAMPDQNALYFVNVTTGGFGIRSNNKEYSHFFLTGLLNSKLLDWFFKNVSTNFRGGYYAANKQYIEQIPIVEPDKEDKEKIEPIVDQILTAKEEDPEADTSEMEDEIDQLVYELYGLSEEEIGIVEESINS